MMAYNLVETFNKILYSIIAAILFANKIQQQLRALLTKMQSGFVGY